MTDAQGPDPRDIIRAGLQSWATPEQAVFLADEILATTKRVWTDISCKHCRKGGRYQVEISDARAVAAGIKDLLAEGWGRPDVAQQTDEGRIVFERVVWMTDGAAA